MRLRRLKIFKRELKIKKQPKKSWPPKWIRNILMELINHSCRLMQKRNLFLNDIIDFFYKHIQIIIHILILHILKILSKSSFVIEDEKFSTFSGRGSSLSQSKIVVFKKFNIF